MYQAFVDPIAQAITSRGVSNEGEQMDQSREQLAMMKRQAAQQNFDKSYSEVAKGNERIQKDLGVSNPELQSHYQRTWGNNIEDMSTELSKNTNPNSVAHYHLNKYNQMIHDKDMRNFLVQAKQEEANIAEEDKLLEKAPEHLKKKYSGLLGTGRQILERDAEGNTTNKFALSREAREEMVSELRGQHKTFDDIEKDLHQYKPAGATSEQLKQIGVKQLSYISPGDKKRLKSQLAWDQFEDEAKMWEGSGNNSLAKLKDNEDFLNDQVEKGQFKDTAEAKDFYNKAYDQYNNKIENAYQDRLNHMVNKYSLVNPKVEKQGGVSVKVNVENPNAITPAPDVIEKFRNYKKGQTVDKSSLGDAVDQYNQTKSLSVKGEGDNLFHVDYKTLTDKSKLSFHPTADALSGFYQKRLKSALTEAGVGLDINLDAGGTYNNGNIVGTRTIITQTVYDALVPKLFAEYQKNHPHNLFGIGDKKGTYTNLNDFAEKVLGITPGIGPKMGKKGTGYYTIKSTLNVIPNSSGEVQAITHDKTATTNAKRENLYNRANNK